MFDKDVSGYALNDAAEYAFRCQDVYNDKMSFMAAIPAHLRPIFFIPIRIQTGSDHRIASIVANYTNSELFGTSTFSRDDNEPYDFGGGEGSMFAVYPYGKPHQDNESDINMLPSSNTSFYDQDMNDLFPYPYRMNQQVRKSSINPVMMKLSYDRNRLESRTDESIADNSLNCKVGLKSYDKRTKVFSFNVRSGGSDKTVKFGFSDKENVVMSCDCKFWVYNGPEYHAKTGGYLLGNPYGSASKPNIRDKHNRYTLCKHTFAVLKGVNKVVSGIQKSGNEFMSYINDNWHEFNGV